MKKMNKFATVTLHPVIVILILGSLFLGMSFQVCAQQTLKSSGESSDEALQLQQTYSTVSKAAANIVPGSDAPALRRQAANGLNNELENFVASHPNSTLTPGVRLELARNAQLRSGYLRAMNHYRLAWDSLKSSTNLTDRGAAMQASGGAAKMLALTGRMGELDALEAEAHTVFNRRPVGSDWNWALEMRAWVKKHPTEAYKCGLYCLDQLGRLIQPGQFSPRTITETESSTNGFTAAELVQIGGRAGLRIHAALLNDLTNLPVPCIVHLQSEHFIIVRERRGAFYDVYDTIANGSRWLTAAEIAQEATGCVIVSDNISSASLQTISSVAAVVYRGRCHGPLPYDPNDHPCPDGTCCPPGGGSGGGPGPGGGSGGCSKCISGGPVSSGMPIWFVDEPYLNLWMQDTPMQYQPAYGPPVVLQLAYHERVPASVVSGQYWHGATLGNSTTINSINYTYGIWACSWLSFAELDSSENTVDLALPGGGWATFTFPAGSNISDINYLHNTWLEKVGSSGNYTSLILHRPDGSVANYTVADKSDTSYAGLFYISDTSDAAGNKTTFAYDANFLLTTVTAADATTFTLHYDDSNLTSYITSVTSSYGASAFFTYDDSHGSLLGITDAAGISSQFGYENGSYGGAISQLTTPYGTTSFTVFNINVSMFDRIVLIVRPDNTEEFYAQLNDYTLTGNTDWPNFDNSQIPTNTPVGTLDTTGRQERNTFYWNAQQFASYVGGSLYGFTWSDFKKARIRHWLATSTPVYTHFDTLSAEQAPSPDGTTEGQITWYDYAGKQSGINDERGTQIWPSLVARVMPDTSTWYKYSQYNNIGKATNIVEKWNVGNSPLYRTNVYVFDANGVDLTAWTNALGVRAISNVFNTNHQILISYDALNQATTNTYDPTTLQLTSVSLPTGLTTTNLYDRNHRLQKTIDLQVNRTNSYTWYSSGDMQAHTDERGLAVTYYWDGINRLTGTSYPDGTTTTNLYAWGTTNILDRTAAKDRMGFWTYYNYDSLRRLIAVTNANNMVTRYGFCDCGAVAYVTNAWGTLAEQDISYDFDFQGNRLHAYLPNITMTYSYDSLARLTNAADGLGSRYFNYDNLNRLTNTSNAYGTEQGTVLDLENRAVYVTDANRVTSTNTYDDLGRLRTRGYPDGGVEKYGFTLNVSGPTSYTNQIGNVVLYAFDALNRKTNEVYVGVTTNKFVYSGAGDLLALTDGKNQTTTWVYDSFGRVTNKVDAASNLLFVYQYDPDNRLTNRWSIAKGTTVYRYDPVGNLTNVVYPTSPQITLNYDALNHLTNMVDGVGTTAYGYDAAGQLLNEDGPWGSDTVSYTYANRLRTGMSMQAPNASAWTQSYGYDSSRRLTSITSLAGSFGYIYDPVELQRVDKLTFSGGAYITNTFDNVARLTGTYLKNSGNANLDSYAYGYNQASQRINVTRTAGDYVNYTYDNMGELKTAIGKEAGGVTNRWQEQFGYAYDAAGNLNFRTNNALLQTFNVNSLNELTTTTNAGRLTVAGTTTSPATNVTVNTSNALIYADVTFASTNQPWVNGNNTFTAIAKDVYGRKDTNAITVLQATNVYAYDLNGNLLYDGRRAFFYDDENQLIRVTVTNGWKSEFSYDGKMRRRIVKEFTWNGSWVQTNEVHYVYDGNLVAQERDANNLPQVTYTRGTDLSGSLQGAGGIGGLLARTDNSKLSIGDILASALYHADGNGNVTCLIYTNQTIAAKYLYDPYGNMLSQYGSLADANSYRFSSKEWNQNSGLYYYLYRFYNPNLQRWVNRDPLGDQIVLRFYLKSIPARMMWSIGKIFETHNLSTFAENSPTIYSDPLGLKSANTGIKICNEGSDDNYHGFIAVGGQGFGFYPNGSVWWGPGQIKNDNPGDADCYDVKLDDCDYDINKFKDCINKSIKDAQQNPPNYDWLLSNCREWRNRIINGCKTDSKNNALPDNGEFIGI